jgi:hypothetical protein
MTTVTLLLHPETEQKLRLLASHHGQTLESYLLQLAEQAAQEKNGSAEASLTELGDSRRAPGADDEPRYISRPTPTTSELERLLHDLATGPSLPVLPRDFSRADLYDDHD